MKFQWNCRWPYSLQSPSVIFTGPCSFFLLNPAALIELAAVAADDGDPADGGPPKEAALAPTAASAPGECLSVASYRFLLHTAVSFVSSDSHK